MYKLFCCRRNIRRVETDEITDSLEQCLGSERGIAEFRSFLRLNGFDDHLQTLHFILECQNVINRISQLSWYTRTQNIPGDIINQIDRLLVAAKDLNLDLNQMNTVDGYWEMDGQRRADFPEQGKRWATDLLRDIYNQFRRDQLNVM